MIDCISVVEIFNKFMEGTISEDKQHIEQDLWEAVFL